MLCLVFGVMLCTSTASGQSSDENKAIDTGTCSVGAASEKAVNAATGMEMRQVEVRSAIDLRPGVENSIDGDSAVNVAFPGVVNRPPAAVNRVAVPVPILIPVAVPGAVSEPSQRPLEPVRNNLTVNRMNGEVHFKHLQSPHLDPSRALFIETGPGNSWCEFKLPNCTARIAARSKVSVFPDSGSIYLKSGSLIVRVENSSSRRFSVVAGDFACRFQGTTLRVQRDERKVDFQVLEGTVTVFNRVTGEVTRASQVTRPAK